jgi:hypothetical protein
VHVGRNTYGSYQSLPWGTSREQNHSRGPGVSHRDYLAWHKWGISEQQEWFSQGYLYIWGNLKAYGGNICNWKWIKWFKRLCQRLHPSPGRPWYSVPTAVLITCDLWQVPLLWLPIMFKLWFLRWVITLQQHHSPMCKLGWQRAVHHSPKHWILLHIYDFL